MELYRTHGLAITVIGSFTTAYKRIIGTSNIKTESLSGWLAGWLRVAFLLIAGGFFIEELRVVVTTKMDGLLDGTPNLRRGESLC